MERTGEQSNSPDEEYGAKYHLSGIDEETKKEKEVFSLNKIKDDVKQNALENNEISDLLEKIKNDSIETIEADENKLSLEYFELKEKLGKQKEISTAELREFLRLSKTYREMPEKMANKLDDLNAKLKQINEELYLRTSQHWFKQTVLAEKEAIQKLEKEKTSKEEKIRSLKNEIRSIELSNFDKAGVVRAENEFVAKQLGRHIEKSFNVFDELKNGSSSYENLKGEISEEFIKKDILPEISEFVQDKKITNEDAQKYADFAEKLVKEGANYHKDPGNDLETSQQENFEELRKMPEPLRDILLKYKIIKPSYDLDLGNCFEVNEEQRNHDKFFELLISQKKYEFAKNLTEEIEGVNIPDKDRRALIEKIENKIISGSHSEEKNKLSDPDIVNFSNKTFRDIFTDEIFIKWNSVKENKSIKDLFGEELFDKIEGKITEKMKNEILGENRGNTGLQVKYNLKNGEDLFKEAVISYISSSNPHADDYGLRALLDPESSPDFRNAKKWLEDLEKNNPGIAFYLNECLLKENCFRHNPNSFHKPVPPEVLNGALKELPELILSERDLRFKAKMSIKIAKHFISDVTYSDEKRRGMEEDMVKENIIILEKILKDKRLREDFFKAAKSRGKVAEDLTEVLTDQHFANSALLYDIITESSYKKVYFFNSDQIDNPEQYTFTEKDRIHDLNLSKFIEKIANPYRYSLSEEVFDKNFPKLKADIDLSIKVSDQIVDDKLADESRERIVYALMEPDLLDREKAMDLADKIHEKDSREKLFNYIRNPKSKIERAIERMTRDSRKNIEKIENKLTSDEMEKYITELKKVESSYKVSRNLPSEDILDIFKNRRIKNTFDRGLSWQDLTNAKTRDSYERALGTRATGSKKDRHPVAGAMCSNNGLDEKKGAAPKYGSAFITLKIDSIKNRTYYIVGDSFLAHQAENREEFFLNLEDAKKAKALKNLDIKAARLGKSFFGDEDYIEAQILGGVMVNDIESINFREDEDIINTPEFEEIKKNAEKNDIEVNIIKLH